MTTSPEGLSQAVAAQPAAGEGLAPLRWRRHLRDPRLWFLAALLLGITLSHYQGEADQPSFLVHVVSDLGLSRYDLERILYIVPMIWSGFLFGRKGALFTAALALAAMLPRTFMFSPHTSESLFETGAVFIVGGWAGLSSAMLMEERDRHLQLITLYRVSSDVARSLDLGQILDSSVQSVVEALRVDAAMVFLSDEDSGDLVLTAHYGLPPTVAAHCGRLVVGDSLNGVVARSGEPMYVADSANDPRMTNDSVRQAGIRSQLIVPVQAKDNVLGTLCVATRRVRRFRPGEVELLTAIGNHIGMALEKARLYSQRERMEENLHFYLQQITRAQEEERKRVARELHDDTIQALVIHSRRLDELASDESLPAEKVRARLEDLLEDTNEIVKGVRRLSRDLRPATLDRLGLLPALERLAADVNQEGHLSVEVRTAGREHRLSPEAAIALFRIAQEALNNVRRHAQASRAEVLIEYLDSRLRLTVSDDGKGFAAHHSPLSALPRDGKLGLAGMEERARLLGGEVAIESEPGRGTRVRVEVPV